MPEMVLRTCTIEDHEAVTSLWHGCGLHPSRSDSMEGLARKLERDPDLFLVAVSDGEVIGTVLGSYDGRRGWINRLAVRHDFRGKGLADRLMAEVERRLVAISCEAYQDPRFKYFRDLPEDRYEAFLSAPLIATR